MFYIIYTYQNDNNSKNSLWHKGVIETSYAGRVKFNNTKLGIVSLKIRLFVDSIRPYNGRFWYKLKSKKIVCV